MIALIVLELESTMIKSFSHRHLLIFFHKRLVAVLEYIRLLQVFDLHHTRDVFSGIINDKKA